MSRCPQGCASLEALGGSLFPWLFWLLEVACIPWFAATSPQPLFPLLHLTLSLTLMSPFYKILIVTMDKPGYFPISGSLIHLRGPFCHVRQRIYRFWTLEHGPLCWGAHSESGGKT